MEPKVFMLRGKLEKPGKIFHTTDKKIRRQRVSLSDSTLPQEKSVNVPIDCNRI
jgi:hypothetical protein